MSKKEEYIKNPNLCLNCGKPILLKEGQHLSDIKIKKFCNRSCAGTYNNNKSPKRTKKDCYCKECNCLIQNKKKENGKGYLIRTVCDACLEKRKFFSNYTKKQHYDNYEIPHYAKVHITKNARKTYQESDKPKQCIYCGYDKHYEVCHVKAIADFEDNDLIGTINNIDNLIALCPNHHWEFDKGILDLNEILNK